MTVSADRTLDNFEDTGRKIPLSALSTQVLSELEGVTAEQLTGPGASPAAVTLSRRASSLVFILAHDGAGALEAGGASPAALAIPPVSDFTLDGDQLQNTNARDYSGSTLLVLYKAEAPAEQQGGQSTVTP